MHEFVQISKIENHSGWGREEIEDGQKYKDVTWSRSERGWPVL